MESRQRLDAQLNENEAVKKVSLLCNPRVGQCLDINGSRVIFIGVRDTKITQHDIQTHRRGPGQTGPRGGEE